VTRPQDSLVGGLGDKFFISNNFLNQSRARLAWNTLEVDLAFVSGADNRHEFLLPGADRGAWTNGFTNNFAWGALDITGPGHQSGRRQYTPGAAFYVSELFGAALSGQTVTNIFGHGLNCYYDPALGGNAYLQGLTYALRTVAGWPRPLPGPSPPFPAVWGCAWAASWSWPPPAGAAAVSP